ncbi:hypothetical protein Y1Q_0017463 [Alligator mississippiensis]|uniref:Uncharacterized protein n=1 Tax=Alligator mississippiensis TaxID=8496 RepID=A0A151P215_ALLMI|nr:hypothetical protein Y1Q_0017463 [Alligator mississippiensis]
MQLIYHPLLPRPKNMLDLHRQWQLWTCFRSTATHGCLERPPTHTTEEHCRDFCSKQRQFHKTSLEVLADSSVARAEHADAWWDELHESLLKDDAILKKVWDTMQNFKDVINKSHVELQRSQDSWNDAFQSV